MNTIAALQRTLERNDKEAYLLVPAAKHREVALMSTYLLLAIAQATKLRMSVSTSVKSKTHKMFVRFYPSCFIKRKLIQVF